MTEEPAPAVVDNRPLLALNCIVKDGGDAFRNMLKSVVEHVDELVIGVDNRTSDDTKKIVYECLPKGKTLRMFDFEWRNDFAYARNLVLDETTAKVMIWLDHDDVFVGDGANLRKAATLLAKMGDLPDHPESRDAFLWKYEYSHDDRGNVIYEHDRERMVRPKEVRWISRVHETLRFGNGSRLARVIHDPTLRVIHAGHDNLPREARNGHLLWLALVDALPEDKRPAEDYNNWSVEDVQAYFERENLPFEEVAGPLCSDPRTLMYQGYRTFSAQAFAEAEKWFLAFLKWPSAGAGRSLEIGDRWQALTFLGKVRLLQYYDAKKSGRMDTAKLKLAEAKSSYLQAMDLNPDWPDAHFGLADIKIEEGRHEHALIYTNRGMQLVEEGSWPHLMLFVNALEYKLAPCVQMQNICYAMGDIPGALAWCEKGLEVQPQHELLADYAKQYRIALRRDDEAKSAVTLLEAAIRGDAPKRALDLHAALPHYVRAVPRVAELRGYAEGQLSHLAHPLLYKDYYRTNDGWSPTPDDWVELLHQHPRFMYIKDAVPDGAHVLDLGMSDGFVHPLLLDKGCEFTGVDIDPRCVAAAKERAQRYGYSDRAIYVEGMAEEFLEAQIERGARYDVVLMSELLEHVIDPARLYELAEKVADRIVVTVPDGAYEHGEVEGWETDKPRGHVRTWDREGFAEFLVGKAGRRIVELFSVQVDEWLGEIMLNKEGSVHHGWICAATEPAREDNGRYCTIWCGPGLEPWSPLNVRWSGLGGSETAVVNVSRELAAMGWNVRVWAEADGVWDGVRYRKYDEVTVADLMQNDLLVLWRRPDILDQLPAKPEGHCALWLHDTSCGDALTPEIAGKLDSIMYLSAWHGEHLLERYPWLVPGSPTLVRTYNGTDSLDISGIERDPHRLLWASSPDRGLDVLLEHWSDIKAVWGDAKLTVAYGFENLDKMAHVYPELAEFKAKVLALMEKHHDDVENIGRVDWKRLRREWASSGVFLYPPPSNGFCETACISVVEAAAAGAIPITNANGALPETCGEYGYAVIHEEGEAWWTVALDHLRQFDTDPTRTLEVREQLKRGSLTYSWKRAAQTFAALIEY